MRKNLFQIAKQFLSNITNTKPETTRTRKFSAMFENLEARQMMTANGFGDPMAVDESPVAEVTPIQEVGPVSVVGVSVRVNGEQSYISSETPRIDLKPGDFLEIISVDLHVDESLQDPNGVFALEGYVSKIVSDDGPSVTDNLDGRFTARDSALDVGLGDLTLTGLEGGWNIDNGWDRLTLNVAHYFGDSSRSETTISINMQVGTPEFAFADDVDDFADQPIYVGDEVNIVGSWLNNGSGRFHNYAEVDIFFECDSAPSWVGVLVGNANATNGVSGEFLFPTENGDQFSERWSPEKAGTYRIEFTVDPEKLWNESDETNNRIQLEIKVSEPISKVNVGDLGHGVVAQDSATGEGFIMYSAENIHERFANQKVYPGNADHFVSVRVSNGQWQYDTNNQYVNFTPKATDVLVARVDFSADTVDSLQGTNVLTNGMQMGYASGDIEFEANVWGGKRNIGEFGLTGSFVSFFKNNDNPIQFSNQKFEAPETAAVGSILER